MYCKKECVGCQIENFQLCKNASCECLTDLDCLINEITSFAEGDVSRQETRDSSVLFIFDYKKHRLYFEYFFKHKEEDTFETTLFAFKDDDLVFDFDGTLLDAYRKVKELT